jgi:hypothetical protein
VRRQEAGACSRAAAAPTPKGLQARGALQLVSNNTTAAQEGAAARCIQ